MKKVIETANVATMTMYSHFSFKIQLIEQVLIRCNSQYWSYLNTYVGSDWEFPLLQVVKGNEKWMKENGRNGCMFLRAIDEYAGTNNRIEQIARNHKNDLLQYFRDLARKSRKTGHSNVEFSVKNMGEKCKHNAS